MWRSSETNAERYPGSDPRPLLGRRPFEDIGCRPFGRATDRFGQTRRHRLVAPVARPPHQLTLVLRLVSVLSRYCPSARCLLGPECCLSNAKSAIEPSTGCSLIGTVPEAVLFLLVSSFFDEREKSPHWRSYGNKGRMPAVYRDGARPRAAQSPFDSFLARVASSGEMHLGEGNKDGQTPK